MIESTTLVSAKWIITCEETNRILQDHTLVIDQGKIIDILPRTQAIKKYPAARQEDYSTHAILPGFINAHTHIAMSLFRGLADDLELMDWLKNHIWPAESKWVSEELLYDGSQLAMKFVFPLWKKPNYSNVASVKSQT